MSSVVEYPSLTARDYFRRRASGVVRRRPVARGRFLYAGGDKIYVKGVTYGTFRPDAQGCEYPDPQIVARDFAQMANHGFNAVRTYTPPPRWLLDLAYENGLWAMIGLPWEQHIAFLDQPERRRAIEAGIRGGVRALVGHPAVLAYAVGNEIPAPIARWYSRRRLERFIERLYRAAKAEDPGALVTYVNYPSTEYLSLPFLDFVCFNVYLEAPANFEAYLARLHNLAGDRPLVMGEIGLDSRRKGETEQASSLDWQVRSAMASGCAGAFVFAWTDEWHRGGHDIEDWDFGLTTRARTPKAALRAVREAFDEAPFPAAASWPRVSVVVCTYNGARTLRGCLQSLEAVHYPDYEVIVVNDGSTDASAAIAREFKCRVITTENQGLSQARNTGWQAASGEIVAYLDDDAYADRHWLQYLAATFRAGNHAAVGGPNILPPADGPIAECVWNAPGGPIHVLATDTLAEHVPGCNLAVRKDRLEALGGFDAQFRVAGDDVDLCWRILERGWTIGYSPSAMVWHHRRNSVRAYWRQQRGYGKAEALLEDKWPEKYNAIGHVKWGGQLYGRGLTRMLGQRTRIYHGVWGGAPFQTAHRGIPRLWSVLPTIPEWYLVILALAGLSLLGGFWGPLLWAVPLLVLAGGATLVQVGLSAAQADFPNAPRYRASMFKRRLLTAFLHLIQPMARLAGRIQNGLTIWRLQVPRERDMHAPRQLALWSESWQAPEVKLKEIEDRLRAQGATLVHGGPWDRWDLKVRGGLLGAACLLMTVEEHGAGKQLFRFRIWPRIAWEGFVGAVLVSLLSVLAGADGDWLVMGILGLAGGLVTLRMLQASSAALAALRWAITSGDSAASGSGGAR
jgi:glycosyltransferase involved in cell wall biosynthesis